MCNLPEYFERDYSQDDLYSDAKGNELLKVINRLDNYSLYKIIKPDHISNTRLRIDVYLYQIKEWEYCYCRKCKKVINCKDLKPTEQGIVCTFCNSYDLEPPRWVACPNHKVSSVKCPRGGRGIIKTEQGYECQDYCYFRRQ